MCEVLVTMASLALALQAGAPSLDERKPLVQEIQYRVYAHPPPCGHGYDLSARDGLCYPNGTLAPQDQAARRYYRRDYDDHYYGGREYRGGRYPVPCGGHGVDLDIRDGRCYPAGMVPRQFQNRPEYQYGGPRRGYD
jgi:hypothetical protein